ncbi:DinB family protein [Cytobacillus oceanisediminis]|uniref:DinB family protein n=1 Tax=Cytobacillus oceanisediminis TaxID=665099 RepID=UPI001C23129E|nr:DinB family protein [Cytobacillus oceanisediminis]MBU8769446.1 DinB family protein [Cytobacillus oceanisediminis]MCM3392678.1 DinB family protein [Cytobacillus oceanisediminis]
MQALIEEYSRGFTMLRESISELSEEEIRYNPGKDKWSIHQIIIHITDSELVATHRMKKVLSEPEPLLPAPDQDAWASSLVYEQLDREQYLLLFKMLRSSMLPILHNLTTEQLERIAVYPDGARLTFKDLLEFRVDHIRGHLDQIERVKKAFREKHK